MKKGLKITSLVFNALTFLAMVFCVLNLVLGIYEPATPITEFLSLELTMLSFDLAVLVAIASLIKMISDIVCLAKKRPIVPGFPAVFKYITTVGLVGVVMLYWIYRVALTGADHPLDLLQSWKLYALVVVPFLSFVSLIFFEKGRRIRYRCYPLSFVIPAVYCIVVVVLEAFAIIDDSSFAPLVYFPPLDFAAWGGDISELLIILAIPVGSVLIFGILFLVFHNIRALRPGAVAEIEETPAEPVVEEQEPVAAAQPKQVRILKGFYSPSSKVTHVIRLENGEWQVKSGIDGSTENFRTQAEAIRYANGISKQFGGSVRIHARND